ncbi:antileukoproteinase-like [Pyxicephalus adspersus]|uniref:antileukoproteinase-like n=1 Tax=Pyxicephalus adspersus TaxID=30357 RepID=UPI003B5A2799
MNPYSLLFTVALLFLWVEVKCGPIETSTPKPGLCPKPSLLRNLTTPGKNECSNDSDCLGKMRCCDTGRGMTCVHGVRPGFCPFNDLPVGDKTEPKCVSDFDCTLKIAKCCDRASSKDCMPRLKEKPGKCPNVSKPKSDTPCSSDHDCDVSLKCCSNFCIVPEKVTSPFQLN